jgi:hypothetical protein
MTQLLSKRISTAILISALLSPITLFGQSASSEELLAIIKKMEARITELEAKAGKAPEATAATTPAGVPAAAAAEAPTTVELKKEIEEIKKQDSDSAPILNFFKQTQVTGYVDAYFGYDLNQPQSQIVGLRGVTTNHDSFQLNAAKLSFYKPTTGLNTLGYRFDLVYGPLADSFHSYEPVPGQQTIVKNFLNAYVSYVVPVGKGLTVDVGKFTTFVGAEVFDTVDNWNYQQSILFGYAQPYYHTGLRTLYNPSEKVGLGFYLVNGWNNSFDNNTGKSYGFSLTLTPNSKFQFIQNYLGGPERNHTNDPWRHLFDTVVNATINKNVALKFNYDYGFDNFNPAVSSNVSWQGFAAGIRFSTSSQRVSLAPRFEYFSDNAAYTTGVRQAVKEITLTNEYRIRPNFSTKLEYRYDFSNQPYFPKHEDELVKGQSVFLVGVVYSFGFGKE